MVLIANLVFTCSGNQISSWHQFLSHLFGNFISWFYPSMSFSTLYAFVLVISLVHYSDSLLYSLSILSSLFFPWWWSLSILDKCDDDMTFFLLNFVSTSAYERNTRLGKGPMNLTGIQSQRFLYRWSILGYVNVIQS